MSQIDITTTFSENQHLVTISFFKYKGTNILWALKEMQMAKKPLSETPGLNFFKLMGSGGGNGFSLKPDFNVYALVAVWKNKNYSKNFFRTSKVLRGFKDRSKEWWTIYMAPLKSKGYWNKLNPFLPVTSDTQYEGPVGVLTRATISPQHLLSFWKPVPAVSEILKDQDGLLFSKGIGEYPLFLQGTFSLWKSKRDVQLFTYHFQKHEDVVEKTNKIGWYNEDLFAEFKILETEGSWEGIQLFLTDGENRRGEAVHDLINQTLSANKKIITK